MQKRNGEKSTTIHFQITCIAINSDGLKVYSGGKDRTLRLWDCQKKKNIEIWSDSKIDKFYKLLISSDDRWLLSGHRNGQVAQWDCVTGKCLAIWKDHQSDICAIALSPDNRWAISCDLSMQVIIRSTKNGKIYQRHNFGFSVTAAQWENNLTDLVLLGMSDGSVSVWKFCSENASLSLLWRTKTWRLHVKGCALVGVHGLSTAQQIGLELDSATVQQSTKSSEDEILANGVVKKGILSQREAAIPYRVDKPFYSAFDSSVALTPEDAVVTLARRQSGEGEQHAFLVIESIENNYYHARRIDFVLDTRQNIHQNTAQQSKTTDYFGKGLIEVADKAYEDVKLLAEQCYFKTSTISYQKSVLLYKNIKDDMAKLLSYAKPGNSDIYRIFRMQDAIAHHNCLTWCEDQLQKIGVQLTKKSWVDKFGVDPTKKIGNVGDPFANWTLL